MKKNIKPQKPTLCTNCKGSKFCKTCEKCTNCYCRCRPCPTCTKLTPDYQWCRVCGVCRGCCECRKSPKFVPDQKLRILSGGRFLSNFPRTLGIELEIGDWKTLQAGIPIPNLHYITTHDWSVKPSETEMVISPMIGDAFVRGMLGLSRMVVANQCDLNTTCALHVHVGAKDLSHWELRRLLEIYVRIEKDIYKYLIAPHRSSQTEIHYCQMLTVPHITVGCARCERYDQQYPGQRVQPEPIDTTLRRMSSARSQGDIKLCLLRMLYGVENASTDYYNTVYTRKGGKYEYARYFGLNLHSFEHRKTVEWRMKEATSDPWDMVCWPLWCGWATHAATRLTDEQARSVTDLRSFTKSIMPGFVAEWVDRKIAAVEGKKK